MVRSLSLSRSRGNSSRPNGYSCGGGGAGSFLAEVAKEHVAAREKQKQQAQQGQQGKENERCAQPERCPSAALPAPSSPRVTPALALDSATVSAGTSPPAELLGGRAPAAAGRGAGDAVAGLLSQDVVVGESDEDLELSADLDDSMDDGMDDGVDDVDEWGGFDGFETSPARSPKPSGRIIMSLPTRCW